jgi:hypothetical protein
MTRHLRPVLGAALIFIVLVVAPRPAFAGGYDVISCNQTVAGGANHSWGAAADSGMTAYTDCPARQGIVARSVYDGAASTFLQGAYMIFDAPEGNSIDSISFEVGMRRPDCSWGVELVGGNRDLAGNILFGLPAGQSCDSQFQTDENTFLGGRYTYAVGAPRVRIEARCGAGSCTRNGVASIHLRNVDVRVHDDVAPALSGGRGNLWTSNGWLAGSQAIGFDASDGAGIQEADVLVDGRSVLQQRNSCDFTYATPCGQASIDQSFVTAAFGVDGPHTLTLAATDAAGNPSSVARTVYIDNSPPDAPQNVAVVGGDDWRSSDDFTVNWTSAPPASGAPVAGAEWDLCPTPTTTTASCAHGSANGAALTSLTHLKLPAPGAYTLKLWLRDAAGNQDDRLAAPPVTLRYDDASPNLAFLAPDPNDPTLIAVQTSDLGSGVASGQIQMRRQGVGNWLSLPTAVQDGQLVAHVDDQHLGDGIFELQATATDVAGNQRTTATRTDGSVETVTLPLRLKTSLKSGVVVRHGSKAHLARSAYARYGQLVRVRGTLKSPEGNPLQDVEVQAFTQIKDGVTPARLIATVKTSRTGAFSFLVRKGPSRSIKIQYGGTSQIRSATENLNLNVRSQTSMRPNHRRRVNGESVRFHGRIRTGRIPKDGKIVEVQVWVRGRWRTFATTRAGHKGSWAYDYRFDGTRGNQTYRFRAKVPRETGYPFATGRSGIVRVRVHGV